MTTHATITKEIPVPKSPIRPAIKGDTGKRFWMYCQQNNLFMDHVATQLVEQWLAEQQASTESKAA